MGPSINGAISGESLFNSHEGLLAFLFIQQQSIFRYPSWLASSTVFSFYQQLKKITAYSMRNEEKQVLCKAIDLGDHSNCPPHQRLSGPNRVPGRLRGKITVNTTTDVIGFAPLKRLQK